MGNLNNDPELRLMTGFLKLDRCPHCGASNPNLNQIHSWTTTTHTGENQRVWAVYVCTRCGGSVMGSANKMNQTVHEIFPLPEVLHESLPTTASKFLKQAIDSLASPSASIVMSASAVDAMLINKGIDGKGDTLNKRIKLAAEKHLITNEMSEWAHSVRLDANAERHPSSEHEFPTTEDARHTLQFAKALAEFLFVLPYKVQQGLKESGSGTPS